ncbi:unnamed protein product [Lymnaea stagnalis]|uniref:RCC1-like domain-containing protein n=1 Tax=Lymnaea stagnalis TaxID=6523 RepID=A0AAV2GYD3_LYMST
MYQLFEFVRLLSVRSNHQNKPSHGKVDIMRIAWKEEGEVSFLALLCSNDHLLLRYDVSGRSPIIKQLPWLPEKSIGSMCFDQTLTWLLIVTEVSQEIFIVPALSIIDSEAVVNQIFKTDDITKLTFKITSGNVSCGIWWQTLEGKQVAVIGTTVGEILFIDLLGEGSSTKVTIDVTITDLSLSQDDLQMNTTLLITTITGNQWKLLLETRSTTVSFSPDSDIKDMGYDSIDGRNVPPLTILDSAVENGFLFTPSQFINFQPPTYLRPQYARGRHFITAHCTLSSTLQVLDSVSQNNPLFVYKLPVGAENTILTDKLIFTVINHSRDRKVFILSNQKSENSLDEHQEFNMDAVIQEFDLAEGENLVGVERKRYPFYYHEHNENEWAKRTRAGSVQQMRSHDVHLDNAVLSLPVTTHTVLDGCVIVTNCSVYEIRPRISPERLFLHLAMTLPETTVAENLAISIGLDLTSLSELAAECMLKKSYFGRAMKLYTLSKCPAAKRTGGLARHGCITETLMHLRNVLSSPTFELNTWERKFLSSMLLHCFVYQLHSPGQTMANTQMGLSDFLFGSFSFDEHMALNLLADFGEVELLLSLAKARGLVVDALTALVKSEAFPAISFSALSDLVQRGFCAHLLQSGSGCLLPCLSPEDLVRLLTTRPQLAIQNFSLLKPLIPILKLNHLLELARIFDPSKSVMRGTLLRLQTMRRRTNSLTSLGSMASDSTENQLDSRELQAEFLIEFFLLVILHINTQRRQLTNRRLPPFDKIVTSPADDLEELDKAQNSHDTHKKLLVQAQPVACGPKHSAAVRNCDLYTWGRSAQGRLGHGDLSQPSCPPMRVETLHILKLRVDAVACGCEHTLALTQQGVYGWGNSKYGQVGVGTCHVYKRPMLLETFQSETVVAVDCGHYHSLALTADHQVYTWGWGVHGQLGHGNPEDCLIPTHVAYLLSLGVVKVAGGYAHSIVLTEEGDVLTFGSGYFGQLGVGLNNKTSLPLKVALPTPAVIIATKFFHCVAVTASNKVYTWGLHPQNLRQVASSMRSSRLNGGQSQDQGSFLSPALVETTYVHGKITKVCCGSLHSALLADDGGVYVWGRNLEGQLGTGSRQDERMPKMLTSINDQNIVHIASGGEFNLAIDIEGSIWAWGKNDSGQLGYIKSRREGQGPKLMAPNTFRRSLSSHGSEANTPSAMRGLPGSDVTNPHWMALLSTLNQDILWSEPSKTESEDSLDSLPSLDHLGDEMYDSCVVPVTLKVLENVCESSFCLQNSVDLGDWITAGHISCLEGDFVQALFYRLKAVTSSMPEWDKNDIITLCAQLVKYHIHFVSGKVAVDFTMEKVLIQMCSYAIEFWQSNEFPVSQLEAIFLENLPQLATWLGELVLKKSARPSPDHTDFSTHFSLQVLHCHITSVKAMRGGKKDDQEWQRLIAEGSVEPSLLQARVQLQQRDKLTPRDHLLADILRNMKKETGVISLTNTQLNHLDETELSRDDQTTRACLNSVVFTCGHHYSEKTFRLEAVPRLISELTNARTRLPNSASLMKQLLSQSVIRPSACPRCVLNGLRVN